MGIFVKHLMGWHDRKNMDNEGYFELWKQKVREEEEKGNEVLVFSIPKGSAKLTIEQLEAYIQEKLEQ